MWSRDSLLLSTISITSCWRTVLCFVIGHLDLRELLIAGITTIGRSLCLLKEVFEPSRIGTLNHPKARFIAHILGHFGFWWTIVEIEWSFTLDQPARIEPVEWPDS